MPKVIQTPLSSFPYQNVDSSMLDILGDVLYDGYIDVLPDGDLISIKRPGLSEFISTLNTVGKVDSLYWWDAKSVGISVSMGNVSKLTTSSGVFSSITGDKLAEGKRATFAQNGSYLVIANEGKMVYTDGTANTAYITDADAPQDVTHVAFLDDYVIAFQKGTSKVSFADFTTTPTSWSATDFFTAESSPDGLLALHVHRDSRTVILFGSDSTEFWVNDGNTPFSRIQSAPIGKGLMAAHCVVEVDGNFYFFDNNRRLNILSGTLSQELPSSFDRVIQSFSTVSDCIGDYIHIMGKKWLLFQFPTENRSFIYDIENNYWAEWTYWFVPESRRDMFIGRCYAYMRGWNYHLFGSKSTDALYRMDESFYKDHNVEIMHTKRTGHLDHDAPFNTKRCYGLNMRLKTGIGLNSDPSVSPKMLIRYRDNGSTQWSNSLEVNLRSQGNQYFPVELYNLGSYKTRQWEINMSDDAPFQLGKTFEKVDVNVY